MFELEPAATEEEEAVSHGIRGALSLAFQWPWSAVSPQLRSLLIEDQHG